MGWNPAWNDLLEPLQIDPKTLKNPLYQVAHCNDAAPLLLADAIFAGYRLAREIHSSDPARPLPFVREHRLAGNMTDADYDLEHVPLPAIS